ncbi:hypothetical protein Glove_19g70 [Diversispora epigaea]|uniref:Uncharacterized protein n=1 Tax=Diversispora epigaea TaxID=1348612 RepID=A0A397JLX0_9GLOM|nr:hypothetical protein Glove_19g70 [Diversispora epigaea]
MGISSQKQQKQQPTQQQKQQPQQQQQYQQLQYYLQKFGRSHIEEYFQPSLVKEKLKLPKHYHQYKIQNRQQKLQQQQEQLQKSPAELIKYQQAIRRICEVKLNNSHPLEQTTNNNNNNNDQNNKNNKRTREEDENDVVDNTSNNSNNKRVRKDDDKNNNDNNENVKEDNNANNNNYNNINIKRDRDDDYGDNVVVTTVLDITGFYGITKDSDPRKYMAVLEYLKNEILEIIIIHIDPSTLKDEYQTVIAAAKAPEYSNKNVDNFPSSYSTLCKRAETTNRFFTPTQGDLEFFLHLENIFVTQYSSPNTRNISILWSNQIQQNYKYHVGEKSVGDTGVARFVR